MSVVTLDPHCRQLYMRSCGQCEGYVLVSGPLREPTMSRVETLPDEPAWHESKEHACGIRATNGKEGVSAERHVPPCRRRQAWLLVRKESVRGDRACARAKRIRRSCQRAIMAEASEAFSVTGEGSGGKAGDQAGSASPGVAERVARRAPMSVSFGFSRSVVDKKGLSEKVIPPPCGCRLRRGRISVGA